MRTLFTGERRLEQIVSITVGKVRGSISRSLRERTVQAFHKLDDHIIEGAACTEAGDQAFRIHLQCMFLMMVSSAPNNEDILKEKHSDQRRANWVRR
jgi:threonine dehydratase